MYAVTVRSSNTTGRNGNPSTTGGGTGCTSAAIFTTCSVCPFRASGSASTTRTCHTRLSDTLSRSCTSPGSRPAAFAACTWS